MSSLSNISTRNSPRKRRSLTTTSSAPEHAISVSPDGIIPNVGQTSDSNVRGKRRKLLPPATGTTAHVINASSNETQTSGSNAYRKRRQTSTYLSLPDVPPDGSNLGIDDNFPTQFHLPSRKSARRRLSAPAIDKTSPESSQTAPDPPTGHRRTIFAPLRLGPPSHRCRYCGAFFWYEERLRRRQQTSSPEYNKCCKGGSIILPPYKPPPEPLLSLLTSVNKSLSSHFFENIRYYNSMFALTSMGVNVIDSINDGHGPYVFKISGQLCHRIGSLLPREGQQPEYAQLYIFDTENEITNRMRVGTYRKSNFHPKEDIVASLIDMFNTHNPIVQLFRTAHDRMAGGTDDKYIIRMFGEPDKHGDIFSAPVASEVVGLVVGDVGTSDGGRDLIIEGQAGQLQRVEENHCKFMAMQYPILFPYGEDGYHENIIYRQCRRSQSIKRKKATMVEYFAYRLHDRADDFNTPLRCKRGTQAYIVDAYCCVEESRLSHYRTKKFQQKYRTAQFKEIRDSVNKGIIEALEAGQRVVLPSSFVGGPRYLYQIYLDCVALCRRYGCPDLFITFTSNPYWSEVSDALAFIPGQHPTDRPDIVDRVFHIKLDLLMDDIVKEEFFGPVVAVVYTIEFQKRGLPHAHIIVWLDKDGPLNSS